MPTDAYGPESPTMRALSAVTRPSASHPAHASTRTGWRLGWTRSDSSRLNVHFTGRPSSQAARAVWAWLAQSSLPPKAPPLATRWTSTRSSAMPSTSAIWRRSSHTPCPPENTSSVPSSCGTASVDSGSRKACSMRWVWNTSWTVWALAARAASASSPSGWSERA